ncbi:MAG TPA: CarD family transcriptional regulator, partial [Chthonomonadales bacterium]|nr:CarD family transcriptional regulator [Chthonomonadales bacterium]
AALSALADDQPGIVLGTVESVLQRTAPPNCLLPYRFEITVGNSIDFTDIIDRLARMGYQPATTVTRPGEFSRRGGILDVFPSTAVGPARIELYGDEIESIRTFDVTTQRSVNREASVTLAPARELRLERDLVEAGATRIRAALLERTHEIARSGQVDARSVIEQLTDRVEGHLAELQQSAYFDELEQYFRYLIPEPICALDYLPEQCAVVIDEPVQAVDHWHRLTEDVQSARQRQVERGEALDATFSGCDLEVSLARIRALPTLLLSMLQREVAGFEVTSRLNIDASAIGMYRGRITTLADEVGVWLSNDCKVITVSDQPHRVREIFAEVNLPVQPADRKIGAGLHVMEGRLRSGFHVSNIRLYLLTDAELFGSARPLVNRRKVAGGVAISSVLDLRENDYVVHIHHGIGVYRGLVKRKSGDAERDYLLVEYLGGDRLYVPADQIDRVQRYVGTEGAPPTINRIGGSEWQRTTRRAREQAREMAGELIQLYAARQAAARLSFGQDTVWQIEMEDAFPYQETPDQNRAIQEVKADLEGDKPMDRLICGDV